MSTTHKSKVLSGDGAVLARRYASALHDRAVEMNVLAAVEADVRLLQEVIDSSAEFRAMAIHPRLSPAQTQSIIKGLVSSASLNGVTSGFLMILARNRRLGHLATAIETFQANMAARRNQHEAVVTVARPLTQDQASKLATQLGSMVGGTVTLVVEEDKDLIGGLIIKMESSLIDASIKGKLARLERQLKIQQEAA